MGQVIFNSTNLIMPRQFVQNKFVQEFVAISLLFYVFTNPFITIIFYCRGKCESQRRRGGKVWGLRIWVTKRKLWSRGGFGGYPPRRGYCRHGCCRTYRYSNDCYSCCSHAADKPDAEFEDDEN